MRSKLTLVMFSIVVLLIASVATNPSPLSIATPQRNTTNTTSALVEQLPFTIDFGFRR